MTIPTTQPREQASDYQLITHLIGIIFFAGDFKAETANERQLEALLIKTGHRYRSWAEIDALPIFTGTAPEAPDSKQQAAVGEIVANDPVHGWHMNAFKPWSEIGEGTLLYAGLPPRVTQSTVDAQNRIVDQLEASNSRLEAMRAKYATPAATVDAQADTQQEGAAIPVLFDFTPSYQETNPDGYIDCLRIHFPDGRAQVLYRSPTPSRFKDSGATPAATTASADPEGDFAKGMLTQLARMGASPAALSLAVQLFGVGPCPACGFRKLHCRCPVEATTASASDGLCNGCGGNGKVWSAKYERKESCEACNGTGRAPAQQTERMQPSWEAVSRVGSCVAVGSDRIIIATAISAEWADKIVAAMSSATDIGVCRSLDGPASYT